MKLAPHVAAIFCSRDEKAVRIFPGGVRTHVARLLDGLRAISGIAQSGNMRRPPGGPRGADPLAKTRLVLWISFAS